MISGKKKTRCSGRYLGFLLTAKGGHWTEKECLFNYTVQAGRNGDPLYRNVNLYTCFPWGEITPFVVEPGSWKKLGVPGGHPLMRNRITLFVLSFMEYDPA